MKKSKKGMGFKAAASDIAKRQGVPTKTKRKNPYRVKGGYR